MWQERRGVGEGIATELGPVDFAAIGRALGTRGVHVERDEDLEPALRQAREKRLRAEAELDGATPDAVIGDILNTTEVPR